MSDTVNLEDKFFARTPVSESFHYRAIRHVDRCIDAGFLVACRWNIDPGMPLALQIEERGDIEELAWLDEARLKLDKLRSYEAVHGESSALRLTEPVVTGARKVFQGLGLQWPPSSGPTISGT